MPKRWGLKLREGQKKEEISKGRQTDRKSIMMIRCKYRGSK
jgi:hypothetical protein